MKTQKIFIYFFIIITLSHFGCKEEKKQSTLSKGKKTGISEIKILEFKKMKSFIDISGILEAGEKQEIFASEPGQLIALLVADGEKVMEDQHLATLWPENIDKRFNTIEIRSPIQGKIKLHQKKLYSNVEMAIPLFTVVDYKKLLLQIQLDSLITTRIKKWQRVTLKSLSGSVKKIQGTVFQINDNIISIRVLNSEGLLKEGLHVNGEIQIDSHNGMFLEKSFISFNNKKHFVHIKKDSGYIKKEIKILGYNKNLLEIAGSVSAGDSLIKFTYSE